MILRVLCAFFYVYFLAACSFPPQAPKTASLYADPSTSPAAVVVAAAEPAAEPAPVTEKYYETRQHQAELYYDSVQLQADLSHKTALAALQAAAQLAAALSTSAASNIEIAQERTQQVQHIAQSIQAAVAHTYTEIAAPPDYTPVSRSVVTPLLLDIYDLSPSEGTAKPSPPDDYSDILETAREKE